MKRIETKDDAIGAAIAALDLIVTIQSSGIDFDNEAIDVSLASARADLEFVCYSWPKPKSLERAAPSPCEEKSK